MAMGGIVVVDGRSLVGGNGIHRLFLLTEEAHGVDCMKGWNEVCSGRDQAGMLETRQRLGCQGAIRSRSVKGRSQFLCCRGWYDG